MKVTLEGGTHLERRSSLLKDEPLPTNCQHRTFQSRTRKTHTRSPVTVPLLDTGCFMRHQGDGRRSDPSGHPLADYDSQRIDF